jgi:hypothetical protein
MPDIIGEGPALNIGELYVRLKDAFLKKSPCSPDFEVAARRHRLIEAVAHAAAKGDRAVP